METAMSAPRLLLPVVAVVLFIPGVSAIVIGNLGEAGGTGVPVVSPAGVLVLGAALVVVAVHRRDRLGSGPRTAARVGAGLLAVVSGLGAVATIAIFGIAGAVGSNAWMLLVVAAFLGLTAAGFARAVAALAPSTT